jgi:hypothetical protein
MFGGVTPIVVYLGDVRSPATWRGSEIATTNFPEF